MTRTGFIAVLGRPNVGKSTLVNAMVGEKITIVSSKPQTTRNRITGILSRGEDQFVFIDTPGMHAPRTKLGKYMVGAVDHTIGQTDGAIVVVEPEPRVGDIERDILRRLSASGTPIILVINKIDRSNAVRIAETIAAYSEEFELDAVVPTSAVRGKGVDEVLGEAEKFLSEGPWFFPGDIATDQTERRLVSETIREKMLRLLSDEGRFAVVLPADEAARFIGICRDVLLPVRRTDVRTTPRHAAKRVLLEFVHTSSAPAPDRTELVIGTGVHEQYTPEYRALTRDFYLKF